jgi:hypothetical protein
MTYNIERTLHPIFNGQKLEVEVKMTIDRDIEYDGDSPTPVERVWITETKVLAVYDDKGNVLYHIGNGMPAFGGISPELRKVIEDEAQEVEDLTQETNDDNQ